jgi:hypothetical protein
MHARCNLRRRYLKPGVGAGELREQEISQCSPAAVPQEPFGTLPSIDPTPNRTSAALAHAFSAESTIETATPDSRIPGESFGAKAECIAVRRPASALAKKRPRSLQLPLPKAAHKHRPASKCMKVGHYISKTETKTTNEVAKDEGSRPTAI